MKPTYKSDSITDFLDHLVGVKGHHNQAIQNDRCKQPPIGCGGPAVEFTDELSRQEYSISGLCQRCQDEFFDR